MCRYHCTSNVPWTFLFILVTAIAYKSPERADDDDCININISARARPGPITYVDKFIASPRWELWDFANGKLSIGRIWSATHEPAKSTEYLTSLISYCYKEETTCALSHTILNTKFVGNHNVKSLLGGSRAVCNHRSGRSACIPSAPILASCPSSAMMCISSIHRLAESL